MPNIFFVQGLFRPDPSGKQSRIPTEQPHIHAGMSAQTSYKYTSSGGVSNELYFFPNEKSVSRTDFYWDQLKAY